jgi:hypothetical protein
MKTYNRMSHWTWGLLCGALILGGTAARAETADVICAGSTQTRYEPGLTNTPRSVKTSGDANLLCFGAPFFLTTASIHTEGQGMLSCDLSLLPTTPSRFVVKWGDGTSSTANGTPILSEKQNGQFVVVIQGRVTEGRFPGALITRTFVSPSLDINACNSPGGVTQANGSASLTVLGGS